MQPSIAELTRRFLQTPTAETVTAVEPYDVTSAFRVEPGTAWSETQVVLKALGVTTVPKMPADWASHVRSQPAVRFLPMALGHFPQMVSELDRILADEEQPAVGATMNLSITSEAHAINDAAVARWNAGELAEAQALWATLPDSPLKAFNLGVAALALGDHAAAIAQLTAASVGIPDSSGWQALAEIYRSLAELKL